MLQPPTLAGEPLTRREGVWGRAGETPRCVSFQELAASWGREKPESAGWEKTRGSESDWLGSPQMRQLLAEA